MSSNPASASKAFESTMRRIQEQEYEPASKAMQALMVLTFARRPLTVDELRYALAVDLDFPDDGVDEENLYSIEYVKSCCAGLVAVQTSLPLFHTPTLNATPGSIALENQNNGENIVQLVHKSLRDYLSSEPKWFSQPHSKMVLICGAFIDDDRDCSRHEGNHEETKKPYPFLSYAQGHWGSHAANADSERGTAEHGIISKRQVSSSAVDQEAIFKFSFRQLAMELTDMRELFLWACRNGRINIVGLLLKMNPEAFKKPQDDSEDSSLSQRDCGCKSCTVVPLRSPSESETWGSFAREYGYEDDCVRTRSSTIDEGVVSAAHCGSTQTIEFLLSHGASLDGRDVDGLTPLGASALAGDAETLGWLLDHDLTTVRGVQRIQSW